MRVPYATRRESADEALRDAGTKRMLLAEDDPELRARIAGHFRKIGFDVVEASDGFEFLRHLRDMDLGARVANAPHVIVASTRMSGSSCLLDMVSTLRGSKFEIPVVLVVPARQEVDEAAARLGACVVVDHPFDMLELGCAVHAATT